MTTPTENQLYFNSSAATFTGTASSASSTISSVTYAIGDHDNPAGCTLAVNPLSVVSWWNGTGWQCTRSYIATVLANPNTASTAFTGTVSTSLPAGDYQVVFQATDATGLKTTTSGAQIPDFGYGPAPTSANPGYLTILFGRAQWTQAENGGGCAALPTGDTETLAQIGAYLDDAGGGTITQVQEQGASETAQSTSLSTSITTSAGDLLVVTAALRGVNTFGTTPVSDSAGDTFTLIATKATGINVTGMFYAANAGANTSVTVTASGTATIAESVQEFSGVSTTSPLDVSVGATATSTSPASGSTAATANPVELAVAGLGWNTLATASAQTAGYTVNSTHASTPSGELNNVQSAYQVTSATGAQAYGATLSMSAEWGDIVATFKQAVGYTATANVVVDRANSAQSGSPCQSGNTYASWSQLQALQANNGWDAVSASLDYPSTYSALDSAAANETCNTLSTFTTEGFPDADGMFAYPNNLFYDSGGTAGSNFPVQLAPYVQSCFDFGRTYEGTRNIESSQAIDGFQKTFSVQGGTPNSSGGTYTNPATIANLMSVAGGQWDAVQFYKFVVGSGSDTYGDTWNCTGSSWTTHYAEFGATGATEAYCWNDFQTVIASIPAHVETVSPYAVATAWGITP